MTAHLETGDADAPRRAFGAAAPADQMGAFGALTPGEIEAGRRFWNEHSSSRLR